MPAVMILSEAQGLTSGTLHEHEKDLLPKGTRQEKKVHLTTKFLSKTELRHIPAPAITQGQRHYQLLLKQEPLLS